MNKKFLIMIGALLCLGRSHAMESEPALEQTFEQGFDQALDLRLLRNDKEAVSRYSLRHPPGVPTAMDLSLAHASFEEFGFALNSLLPSRSPSEIQLIRGFQTRLAERSLPSDHDSIQSFFLEWRRRQWIDDLLLEVLDQNHSLLQTLEQNQIPRLSGTTRAAGHRLTHSRKITPDVLNDALAPLKGSTPLSPGMAPDFWPGIAANLKQLAQHPDSVRLLVNQAYLLGCLTPLEFSLADALRLNRVEDWPLHLGPYLRMIRTFKNNKTPASPTSLDLSPNPFSSQTIYRKNSLTWRKSLYSRFSPLQSNLLVSLMKRLFERMNADQAALVFSSASGTSSESIPLSPMGQYFFARKLLLKDMQDLNRSVLFRESPFVFEDLITASLESGLINSGILQEVYQIDDLWNPVMKPWSKVAGFALQATGNAAVFLPPPYNVISSVALILIEARMQKSTLRGSQNTTGYDPF